MSRICWRNIGIICMSIVMAVLRRWRDSLLLFFNLWLGYSSSWIDFLLVMCWEPHQESRNVHGCSRRENIQNHRNLLHLIFQNCFRTQLSTIRLSNGLCIFIKYWSTGNWEMSCCRLMMNLIWRYSRNLWKGNLSVLVKITIGIRRNYRLLFRNCCFIWRHVVTM